MDDIREQLNVEWMEGDDFTVHVIVERDGKVAALDLFIVDEPVDAYTVMERVAGEWRAIRHGYAHFMDTFYPDMHVDGRHVYKKYLGDVESMAKVVGQKVLDRLADQGG